MRSIVKELNISVYGSDPGMMQTVQQGTKLIELFDKQEVEGFPIVAALYNNELQSLQSPADINGVLKAVPLNSTYGARVYRRSLCFLLEMAARDSFPNRRLFLSHSLGDSYYYHQANGLVFNSRELTKIKKRMEYLVSQNFNIEPDLISWSDGIRYFNSMDQDDTVVLLKSTNQSRVKINRVNNYMALGYEVLLPGTGMLQCFDIQSYEGGFILRYPPQSDPLELQKFRDEPLLFSIYKEYKSWGKILNADTVGKLNAMVATRNGTNHFIQVSESLHNKKIALIADEILKQKGKVKVVLIAGPSSSGKTTFTKKLCLQLQVVGFNPLMLSLDDYYKPREEVPVDEENKVDFEALEALDIPLLNDNLLQLFKGEEVEIPIFDFKQAVRQKMGRQIQLNERSLVVMEGIHGLNNNLTPQLDEKIKFKIYISPLTQLNLDDHNRIATTDNRLIRRIVRDNQFRNYSAEKTIRIWPSVRRGEEKNIFPYQDQADAAFNSALDYELAVLRLFAEPLLKGINPDKEEYAEAQRLLHFLDNFSPIPPSHIPGDSILREFIGNSSFKY